MPCAKTFKEAGGCHESSLHVVETAVVELHNAYEAKTSTRCASPLSRQRFKPLPVSEAVSIFLQSRPCYDLLSHYASKEYSLENLHFWRHCMEYRALLEAENFVKTTEFENQMLALYITEGSEFELNLSCGLKRRVREAPHQSDLWFEVQNEVANLIRRGPYLRLALEVSSLVSTSWKKVLDVISLEEAGEFFYKTLFNVAPELRPMFKTNISVQAQMLAEMLNECVGLLVNLEQLLVAVMDLGRRHRAYNVKPEHFKVVGEALLSTLQRALKEEFDARTQRAWITVFELISTIMIIAIDPAQVNVFIVEPAISSMEQDEVSLTDSSSLNGKSFCENTELKIDFGEQENRPILSGASRLLCRNPLSRATALPFLAALSIICAGILTWVLALRYF